MNKILNIEFLNFAQNSVESLCKIIGEVRERVESRVVVVSKYLIILTKIKQKQTPKKI